MNLNKEFIPYEIALELKELGFDDECIAIYTTYSTVTQKNYKKGPALSIVRQKSQFTQKAAIKAPLYQQAFRWFRENYKLWSMIYPKDGWNYAIQRIDETTSCTEESFHGVEINLYEEAELECLKKLIEIVKNK